MSVPLFQRGETYTLKEIISISNAKTDEELSAYMNLEFKPIGIQHNDLKKNEGAK